MPVALKVQALVPEKKEGDKVVQAKIGPFQIEIQSGTTAAEMIQMFGDEAVKSNAESNWIVTIQSNMRSQMKKGKTQAEIQAALGGAKMGVAQKAAPIDVKQGYLALFASATPEQQAAMLAELKAKAGKK